MNIAKTIFFFSFIANMNLMVRADEEDDFGELLLDFGSGVAAATCEADETCRGDGCPYHPYVNNCLV